jgi:hypothetical protein
LVGLENYFFFPLVCPYFIDKPTQVFSQSSGNFVVVDESGKKEALESGSKVACIVVQVLVYAQVRALQKSAEW